MDVDPWTARDPWQPSPGAARAPGPWRSPRCRLGNPHPPTSAVTEANSEPQDAKPKDVDIAATLLKAAAGGGCSRHNLAAVASSLFKLASGRPAGSVADEISERVIDRLSMIVPSLTSQVTAGLRGEEHHSAHGLAPGPTILDRNVALHAGFTNSSLASEWPSSQKRRLQRGARTPQRCGDNEPQPAHAGVDGVLPVTLQDAPASCSETRFQDEDATVRVAAHAAPASENATLSPSEAIGAAIRTHLPSIAAKISGDLAENNAAFTKQFSEHFLGKLRGFGEEVSALKQQVGDIQDQLKDFQRLQADMDSLGQELLLFKGRGPSASVGSAQKDVPYKFLALGRCTKGTACAFVHASPSWEGELVRDTVPCETPDQDVLLMYSNTVDLTVAQWQSEIALGYCTSGIGDASADRYAMVDRMMTDSGVAPEDWENTKRRMLHELTKSPSELPD